MRDLFFTGDKPKSKLNKIKVSATDFANYLPNKSRKRKRRSTMKRKKRMKQEYNLEGRGE